MAYHVEKDTGDVVFDGFDKGIAPSPHLGIADIKNANINSFPGEAGVNFNRISQIPTGTGTFTALGSSQVTYGGSSLQLGSVVSISASTISGLSTGVYWVSGKSGTSYNLSASWNGSNISGLGLTGTATFSIITPQRLVQGATEIASNTSGTIRYYMLDANGHLWVSQAGVYGGNWSEVNSTGLSTNGLCTGLAVSQGVVLVFNNDNAPSGTNFGVNWQFTNQLGNTWNPIVSGGVWPTASSALSLIVFATPIGSSSSHYAIATPAANGDVFYCDGPFVGHIESSQGQYTRTSVFTNGSDGTITMANVSGVPNTLEGVAPVNGLAVSVYPTVGGALPTYNSGAGTLTAGTVYYIVNVSGNTFGLSLTSGGAALTQINAASFYITSFYPTSSTLTFVFPKAIQLPYYETSNCLEFIEPGSAQVAVGTTGKNLYLWANSTSVAQPFQVLTLPEFNTHRLLNVDNILYAFSGYKGNIYITNGTTIAGAMTVPDYCANPNGGNQDPYFQWGDVMFLRGRVFFSIQDQNSTNLVGNCGGVWSFTPTQNLFLGQDQGVQLHLENQNSYGTYNGICDVLLPSQNQQANGPQFWAAWTSYDNTYSNPLYGIDFSGTSPYNTTQYAQIDTDIIPIGTSLQKFTASNIEFKLSRPLVSGEKITIQARKHLSDTFVDVIGPGGSGTDSTVGDLSYPFDANFAENQWVQFRLKLYSTTSSPSYVPLKEMRIRTR